jgi:hypothetical protein
MAVTCKWLQKGLEAMGKGLLGDLSSAANDITVNLVTDSWTPTQQTDASWAAISANEGSGAGYAAVVLTGKTVTSSALVIKFDADDADFGTCTVTFRYVTVRKSDYLIGYVDMGENKVYSASPCKVMWSATNGWGKITAS